jgi:hypothetical protein
LEQPTDIFSAAQSAFRNTGKTMNKKQVFCIMLPLLAALGYAPISAASFLSDNLSASPVYSQNAPGVTSTDWYASSFMTDGYSYTLQSVAFLMAMTSSSGAAQAAIFTDVSDQPGSQVGALISPGSYSNALASTSFTASGITLAANTTYWVVLSASSGNFNWAWTDSNIGSGVGFTHTWSGSDDAGSSWLTFHDSPQIMQVDANAIPEPAALWLFGIGLAGMRLVERRRIGV